jgi:DNA-binding Lrp family transcriptional regulator
MAVRKSSDVTLDPDDLTDLDRAILDYLHEDGRATPKLIQQELQARGVDTGVRQNVSARLKRLREHEYVENVRGTGVYAFLGDPRE